MRKTVLALAMCVPLAGCANAVTTDSGDSGGGTYPAEGSTVELLVPLSPGGTTDIWARILSDALVGQTGARVQVVNDTSGGGLATYTDVIQNPTDTSKVTDFNLPSALKYMYPDTGATFSRQDLAPVGCTGYTPNVIVVNSDSKYHTLQDLIKDAQAHPGQVDAAADGALSDDTVAYANLEKAADAKFNTAVVDGTSEKVTALLGKDVDFFSAGITGVLPQIESGDFRVLATMANKRSPYLKDVPTAKEQGVDVQSDSYFCLTMGAGAPEQDRADLEAALRKVSKDPQYRKANAAVAMQVRFLDGQQMEQEIRHQEQVIRKVIDQIH